MSIPTYSQRQFVLYYHSMARNSGRGICTQRDFELSTYIEISSISFHYLLFAVFWLGIQGPPWIHTGQLRPI